MEIKHLEKRKDYVLQIMKNNESLLEELKSIRHDWEQIEEKPDMLINMSVESIDDLDDYILEVEQHIKLDKQIVNQLQFKN